MGEIVFWVLLLATGAALFLQTLDFKVIAMMDPVMGPARFPQVVLAVLMVSVTGLLIVRLVKKEKTPFIFLELFKGTQLRFGLMILAYILILEKAGFVIATSLFLIVSTTHLYFVEKGSVPVKLTVIRSACIVAATVCLQLLFTKAMGVMLPLGAWL